MDVGERAMIVIAVTRVTVVETIHSFDFRFDRLRELRAWLKNVPVITVVYSQRLNISSAKNLYALDGERETIDADNKSFVRAVKKKKQPSLGAKISEDVEDIQRGETHSSNKLKTGKCNQKLDSYLLLYYPLNWVIAHCTHYEGNLTRVTYNKVSSLRRFSERNACFRYVQSFHPSNPPNLARARAREND